MLQVKSVTKTHLALVASCIAILASLSCVGQTTWSDQDYSDVTERLASDLLNSEKLRDYTKKLGKKPNVSVGLIRSEANDNVDLNELIRRFEFKIFNSNILEITESADFRDEVRKERASQSEFEKEQAFKKWGKEAGANLILFGDLTVKTELRGNKNYHYYTLSLFMTDIETNTRIWFDQEQVKKDEKIELSRASKFDSGPILTQGYQTKVRDTGPPQRYIGIDFNRIHSLGFDNVSPGFGISLFKEKSIRRTGNMLFVGWSFEYFQLGNATVNLGNGSFQSQDPQSPFYGSNNYQGSSTITDKLFIVRPYINFRISGRRLSFYMTQEGGTLLFASKNKAQMNVVSQANSNKTIIESDKNSNSLTLIYGFRMGLGYRISSRIDLATSAGFTMGFIPPLQTTSARITSYSSPMITWSKDPGFLFAYMFAGRITYKLN